MASSKTNEVKISRRYFPCRFGLVHAHTAEPAAGATSRPPLLCLHNYGRSGGVFVPLFSRLGRERRIWAPDFPGFGESDTTPGPSTIEDYAGAVSDMLDQIGPGPYDVLGFHGGSAVGIELAATQPERIRRMAFISVTMFNDDERKKLREVPMSLPASEDGAHVTQSWQGSINWARGVQQWAGPQHDVLTLAIGSFRDKTKAGRHLAWMLGAALNYRIEEQLRRVTQPVMVANPKDDLWEITPRVASFLTNGRVEHWEDVGAGSVDVASPKVFDLIARHLDA